MARLSPFAPFAPSARRGTDPRCKEYRRIGSQIYRPGSGGAGEPDHGQGRDGNQVLQPGREVIHMRIVADAGGNVLVQLRDGEVAVERRGEIIVDLNHDGHWIRGFEVIGGMMDFSLNAATKPFFPSKLGGLRVTYDEEADADYFYLPYGRRFTRLRRDEQQSAETYSHSVNPTGLYRFDAQGGLLSVVIPTADAVKSVDDFLFFFDYEALDECRAPVADG